jgi:hypothetical protein
VVADLVQARASFLRHGLGAAEPAVHDPVGRVRAAREVRVRDRRHLARREQQVGPVAVRAGGFQDREPRDEVHPRRGVEPERLRDPSGSRVWLLEPDDVGARLADRPDDLVEPVGDGGAVPDVERHHGEIDRLERGLRRTSRRGHDRPHRQGEAHRPRAQPSSARHGRRSIVRGSVAMLCALRRPRNHREEDDAWLRTAPSISRS